VRRGKSTHTRGEACKVMTKASKSRIERVSMRISCVSEFLPKLPSRTKLERIRYAILCRHPMSPAADTLGGPGI